VKFLLEIDLYGSFGANTNITAIHELTTDTDICTIFISCFLFHHQKYNVFYAKPFFQNFKNKDL